MREHYTITELTREFGISTRTLRFYEEEGLIAPIRRGRTRLFRQSDRQALREILRGRRLGFSIGEIRDAMGMAQSLPSEARHLRGLVRKLAERRAALEQRRRDVDDLLAELDAVEEACLTRMAELGMPPGG